MASETEGIALLSMYGDDEEEEEAAAATKYEEPATASPPEYYRVEEEEEDENLKDIYKINDYTPQSLPYKSPQNLMQNLTSPSPFRPPDEAELKTLTRSPFLQRTPTPQPPASRSQLSSPFNLTSPSPSPAPLPLPSIQEQSVTVQEVQDGQRPRRSALAIVDYAQDEAAMSPDAEAMEIENYGRVVFGAELHVSEWNVEGTTPVTSRSLTPGSQEPLPPTDAHEQSKSEANIAMNFSGTESDLAEVKSSPTVSTDMQIGKPLQSFLPPAVTTKCSEELQEKINKFLTYKRAGKSFNADLRNRKDYRNPNFLQHAVSYQDIDEIGTCFRKEVFDPHGYDKCDYYDEMEADMKRELERKEQERKKSQKIELVSGGTQYALGIPPPMKMSAPSPASGVPTLPNSSLPPNPVISDALKDGRTNKKSKWDKVDGDTKMPSGGQDNQSNVGVHAAHLSAANAGSGYSAFAQLKRKEAEERKSGERKFDKRS